MIYLTTKSESECINWVSGSGRVRIIITRRIRVRVRVGVMFSISIYHGSNCHRSKCHTFSSAVWKPSLSVFTYPQTVWIFSQIFYPIIPSPTTYTLSSFILSSPSCQIYLTHSPVLVCLRLNLQIGWFSPQIFLPAIFSLFQSRPTDPFSSLVNSSRGTEGWHLIEVNALLTSVPRQLPVC